jgi:hypothetical protein
MLKFQIQEIKLKAEATQSRQIKLNLRNSYKETSTTHKTQTMMALDRQTPEILKHIKSKN